MFPFQAALQDWFQDVQDTDPNQLVQFRVDFFTPHSSFDTGISWELDGIWIWLAFVLLGMEPLMLNRYAWHSSFFERLAGLDPRSLILTHWSFTCWFFDGESLKEVRLDGIWSWTPIVLLGHLEQPVAHTMPVMPAVLVALAWTKKILRSAYHLDFKTCMAQKAQGSCVVKNATSEVFCFFSVLSKQHPWTGWVADTFSGDRGSSLRHQYVILTSSIITALWTTWWNAEVFSGSSESFNIKRTKKQNSWRRKQVNRRQILLIEWKTTSCIHWWRVQFWSVW